MSENNIYFSMLMEKMMLDRWGPVTGNHWNMSNKPTLWKHAVQVDLSVDVIFSPKPLTNMFFAWRNRWLKVMPYAREAPSDTSISLQRMSQWRHVTSSYILLTCILAGSDWIDLGRGNLVGASQTRSASRESGRVEGRGRCWQNPQETGARWRSRMTADVDSMKT